MINQNISPKKVIYYVMSGFVSATLLLTVAHLRLNRLEANATSEPQEFYQKAASTKENTENGINVSIPFDKKEDVKEDIKEDVKEDIKEDTKEGFEELVKKPINLEENLQKDKVSASMMLAPTSTVQTPITPSFVQQVAPSEKVEVSKEQTVFIPEEQTTSTSKEQTTSTSKEQTTSTSKEQTVPTKTDEKVSEIKSNQKTNESGNKSVKTYKNIILTDNQGNTYQRKTPLISDPIKEFTYIIQFGDTLTSISKTHDRPVVDIATRNAIENIDRIQADDSIIIPEKQGE